MFQFSDLPEISTGSILQLKDDLQFTNLLIDSRKNILPKNTLFFAIKGDRHDGHQYIEELYKKGFRQFVIEQPISATNFPQANFFLSRSSVATLQDVSGSLRKRISIPVIGITGSNGKTIIKEWLHQLLSVDFRIIKNPGSYNSQVGVPLSVWSIKGHHELGIFEAGISKPGEMTKLQKVIQPTLGILTNLGSAHDAGFKNRLEKLQEKLKLFTDAKKIFFCSNDKLLADEVERIFPKEKLFSWGSSPDSSLKIDLISKSSIRIFYQDKSDDYLLPYSDSTSIENLAHCIAVLYYFNVPPNEIQKRLALIKPVSMRLEVKKGINGCLLVDDTYNNDVAGLEMSLDFMSSLPGKDKSIILSDIHQSALLEGELTKQISEILLSKGVRKFVGIGPMLSANKRVFSELKAEKKFFPDTENFLHHFSDEMFNREKVLIKGSRSFTFEKIVSRLQEKVHGTVLEIDLNAVVSNLNYFKSKLKPGVKLMAMVKALAYGGGSDEIASVLQYHNLDYLAVAYVDEGVQLRKAGVSLPIMVMNPSPESFDLLIQNNLEPEIYSPMLLKKWLGFLQGNPSSIHIKVETGMNRLGFDEEQLDELVDVLKTNTNLTVVSIFSHLASADKEDHDAFSKLQAEKLLKFSEKIKRALTQKPLIHILNSAGILKFPEMQLDMVRLGIGLYGIDPELKENPELESVFSLKTTISQLKMVMPEETVGYGRLGKSDKPMKIATLSIGYADGYSRAFSNGVGQFYIGGARARVVGNVCMDMTMIDVTGLDVSENDKVLVYGKELSLIEVATWINTIPYEILTNTGPRVRKVYHIESV